MTTARDGAFPILENWKVYNYLSDGSVQVAEGDIYQRYPLA